MINLEKSIIPEKGQTKPRILVVGPGQNQVGGVATFIEILLSSPFLHENYDLIRLDTTRTQEDLGLENRFSIMNLTYLISQIYTFVRIAISEHPRLVHLPVTSGLAFWKAAIFILIGQIFGMKIVAHLHGGMFDQYYRKSIPLERRLIGWVFHRADVVIALSERWRRFLLEEIRPDIHVEVISNTVDLMFAHALNQANNDVIQKEKIILFLGSLGKRKGVFDILKAIPLVCINHPDARFFFAGDEEIRGVKLQIDQICQDNCLADKVQFLGRVTGHAKLELFQRAMIYILPSYGENLPYSLLEAMAVGLPIITTPVGAIPEIIKDDRNGFLIQPGDYEMLAKDIVIILNDTALRDRMFCANVEVIKRRFLPEMVMQQFNNIYSQLIFTGK
jgi:glycosyltransferase involved in cell wall biosynthesis